MFRPEYLILHDYGGTPKGQTPFNPYHTLISGGRKVYRDPANPYGAPAPHAHKLNPRAIGLSWGGPVGGTPSPQDLQLIRDEVATIKKQFPDIKIMSHGEAYAATRGTPWQASKLGRGSDEASWRRYLDGTAPPPIAGGPVPVSQRGITSYAGLGGGNAPATNGADEMKRPVLAGLSNIAANLPGAMPPPMATGSIPAAAPARAQAGGGWNLFDAMTNPLTLAGLSILGDPERNVGRGLAVGTQVGGDMMDRRRQATAQQAFQEMLAGAGGEVGQFAPMIAQMGPERGVPVLMDLIEQGRRRQETAAQWEVEKRLKEAQAAKYEREAKDNGTTRVGLQPIFGRDADGNVVVLQPSASGEMVQARVPEGVKIDPGLAAGEKAAATARGKWEGGAEQRSVGKERLSNQLKNMVGAYLKLDERGGIVNPDKGRLENLQARLSSSTAGQEISGAVGTETQSIRRTITNLQPLLLQGIMQASGMGARAMDSNKELQFYLQAASDPTSGDIYSNLVAIDVLDKTYGLGSVLDETLPADVLARVRRDSERAIQSRPIPSQPEQTQAGTNSQANQKPIPPRAAQMLAADPSPDAIREFDQVFGAGAAQRVLNGR